MSETTLTDAAAYFVPPGPAWKKAVVDIEVARSLEMKLRRSSESRERVEKALVALIQAGTKFTIGCNCQGAAADDDFSGALESARSALHAASKEGV